MWFRIAWDYLKSVNLQVILIVLSWCLMISIGIYEGNSHKQRQWDKANLAALIDARQKENTFGIKTSEVANELQKSHSDIDNIYHDNLVGLLSGSGTMPAPAGGTGPVNAGACRSRLSVEDKALVAAIAHSNDRAARDVIAWQQWYASLQQTFNK